MIAASRMRSMPSPIAYSMPNSVALSTLVAATQPLRRIRVLSSRKCEWRMSWNFACSNAGRRRQLAMSCRRGRRRVRSLSLVPSARTVCGTSRPTRRRRGRHRGTALRTGLARRDTVLHVADVLAALRAGVADGGAGLAHEAMLRGTAQHEVGRRAADLRGRR